MLQWEGCEEQGSRKAGWSGEKNTSRAALSLLLTLAHLFLLLLLTIRESSPGIGSSSFPAQLAQVSEHLIYL